VRLAVGPDVSVRGSFAGCLVGWCAEVIGRRFCEKPSSCYPMLKANVVSNLSSDERAPKSSLQKQLMHSTKCTRLRHEQHANITNKRHLTKEKGNSLVISATKNKNFILLPTFFLIIIVTYK